jgi:hypothetical protein
MRKIISAIVLLSALLLMVAPLVLAQAVVPEPTKCVLRGSWDTADWKAKGMDCPAKGSDCLFDSTTYDCGACCMIDAVYAVSNWVFIVVLTIGFIFIILGAFNIITAGGSPEKVTAGRNYVLYAIIGIVVAVLFRSLPNIVLTIVGIQH